MIILSNPDNLSAEVQSNGTLTTLDVSVSYTDYDATTGAVVGSGVQNDQKLFTGFSTPTFLVAPAAGNIRVITHASIRCTANQCLIQLRISTSTYLFQNFLDTGDAIYFTAEEGFTVSRATTVREFRFRLDQEAVCSRTVAADNVAPAKNFWFPVEPNIPYIVYGKFVCLSATNSLRITLSVPTESSYLTAAIEAVTGSVTAATLVAGASTTNDTSVVATTVSSTTPYAVFTGAFTCSVRGTASIILGQGTGTGTARIRPGSFLFAKGFG